MSDTEFQNYLNMYKKEFEELEIGYSSLSMQEKEINDGKYRELSRKKSAELSRIGPRLTKNQLDYICGIYPELSIEEESFRRGFHHGFITGRSEIDVTEAEVYNWRYKGDEKSFPPGSIFEGKIRDSNKNFEEICQDIAESKEKPLTE